MEEQIKVTETRISEFLVELMKVDIVQENIDNILDIDNEERKNNKMLSICEEIQTILSSNSGQPQPQENPGSTPSSISEKTASDSKQSIDQSNQIQEVVIRCFVTKLSNSNNPSQSKLISNVIIRLVTLNMMSPRLVCIALLSDENLKPVNSVYWLITFSFIKKVISRVDYKGVREIMKVCLERARLLPQNLPHSQLRQCEVLCDLLNLIFDPNASLLPGYFIINELLKIYPDYKTWPHWKLSQLLTDFIDKFRRAAQILSIVGRSKLRPIVELLGHSSSSINSWKLDSITLKFPLKGALPYADDLQDPQPALLRHVLKQPYCREMICNMLDLQKKKLKCTALEDQLVEIIILSLEECANAESLDGCPMPCPCTHISSLLIYLMVYQLISFQSLVQSLHDKMKNCDVRKGRDHLMWVLLQFLSGTIQKYPVTDFHPVLRLIELLYPEREPLKVPDHTDPKCALELSATCILIHILKKATSDNLKTPHALPPAFISHNELVQNLVHNHQLNHLASTFPTSGTPDYRVALLLNAFSTNQEVFHRHIHALSEGIQGNQKQTVSLPGVNCVALASTVPLSMTLLDSLTIHVKMSLIQNIVTHITKHAHNKSSVALAPALVETYARLLVYTETESIGIKQFINNLLPIVFKSQIWGILHALLEMFTHRIHHTLPHYRVQLLSTIHHLAVPLNTMSHMTQLHLCMESVALRIITGLGNSEVMPSLMRFFSTESKPNVISAESEELNRVLVLTMARAIHVTGCDSTGETARWCVDFLKAVMNNTPHNWASHTLHSFPSIIADFYKRYGTSRDTPTLKKDVEEEYCKWKSMSNENDIIAHFSLQHNQSTLFLCLLFKMVFETDRVPAEAYKVLERVGARQLMAHVRTLCDFLILEFSNSAVGVQLSKCVDTMNAIIWQYNIVPIDRLMLCLALRTQEGCSQAQVCLFIIQLLLLKSLEFRNRVQEFCSQNSPEHWKQSNWYERHMTYHRKFPEKFALESHIAGQGSLSTPHQTLPIYFANVCLRLLPVLDLIIHRFLEVPQVHKQLEIILDQLGILYKFHDRPITYLYNTLHYYEDRVRDSPNLKRQLVHAIVMAQQDIKPQGWALTEDYIKYLNCPPDEKWNPTKAYYTSLIKRIVNTLQGKNVFPAMEWRFSEFVNSGTHALHVTCVELMALPIPPTTVSNNLIDTVLKGYCEVPKEEIYEWVNAVGLILTWLPDAYSNVIHNKIISLLQSTHLLKPGPRTMNPFSLLDLKSLLPIMYDTQPALTLALVHSFWHHASFGQVSRIPTLMRERIRPILATEEQLVVLCHLVGPFLQRFTTEIVPRKIIDVTLELYEALAIVDKNVPQLKYQDAICDILYHIKYQFTGDSIKNDVEGIIRGLRPSLQLRLRFITKHNIDSIEGGSSSSSATPGSNISTTSSSNTPSTITTTATSVSSMITTSAISTSNLSSSSMNLPMV